MDERRAADNCGLGKGGMTSFSETIVLRINIISNNNARRQAEKRSVLY